MAIPAGYATFNGGISFVRLSDGSGPYAIDALGNVNSMGLRTASIFKTFVLTSVAAETTLWTPSAGKKFRLMGYCLTSGTLGGNVILKDNTGGTTLLVIPFGSVSAPIQEVLGNGILSSAANNVLTATGTATQTLSGYIYGNEE